MGTIQYDVNTKMTNFYNSMQVDLEDMNQEQLHRQSSDAATIGNFFGSGVVPIQLIIPALLDTNDLNQAQQVLMDGYSFDGQNTYIGTNLVTLTDTLEGNHLKITISDFNLAGIKRIAKVCIIGDEFGGDLVYDRLWFRDNGSQITTKRYKNIRAIIFNDSFGNANGSYDYAHRVIDSYGSPTGRCLVQEVGSLELSAEPIIANQNFQPDIFFRDFSRISSFATLNSMLQDAIGSDKSYTDMDVYTTPFAQREIAKNNPTKKIGQKFYLTANNIQKISILMAVERDAAAVAGSEYDWSGSLTLSLHPLQTSLDCPVAIVPDNLVDFDPSPGAITLATLDMSDLSDRGIVLDDYGQQVDFVFTNDLIADPVNSPLIANSYYVLTINRSGDTSVGDLLFDEAQNLYTGGYLVEFDGSSWTNVTTSDMWFEVHSSNLKINDGVAYQDGTGVQIPKLKKNTSGIEVPWVEKETYYTVAYQNNNYVITEVIEEFSDQEEDPTTGDRVHSRKINAPNLSVLDETDFLAAIGISGIPVVLGRTSDNNPRGNPATITGTVTLPGQAVGNTFHILNPSSTLLANNLVGSILTPNTTKNLRYRITDTLLIVDSYGDVVTSNKIDISDQLRVASWLPDGYDLALNADQTKVINGDITLPEILKADVTDDSVVDVSDLNMIRDYVNNAINSFTSGTSYQRLVLVVENLTDPDPLGVVADIPTADADFTTVPIQPINWRINYIPSWYVDNLNFIDMRRFLPSNFTVDPSATFGGRGDFYFPGNQIIDGYQVNKDSSWYSVDFELNHLSLNVPVTDSYGNPTFLDGYSVGVDLFNAFVGETANGKTANGFTAMKYADKSFVQLSDFPARVKIVPSIQSMASRFSVPFGGNIDDIIGLNYDLNTSNMTLYINNTYRDGYELIPSLRTKILLQVFLKKAGFANTTGEITMDEMQYVLGI
jgi:hypothetical protein